jgi:DNA repair exonuclease SbcCD ATPase subunit
MFTKEQLDQLRMVFREELKPIDARINQLETKTEKRFDQLETRMEILFKGVDEELKTLRKQQKQDREDWIAFFHEAGLFFDEMREQLSKRLTRVEDHLGFSKN